MRHRKVFSHGPKKQLGMVLLIAMVMLIVITMLMITAMRGNIADERMAGNAQDWNMAFQAAESALRDAERDILQVTRVSGATGFSTGCSSTGLCLVSTTGTPIWRQLEIDANPEWMTGVSSGDPNLQKTTQYGTYTNAAPLPKVAAQPRYIIEAVFVRPPSPKPGPISFKYFYRVTAVGFGANIASRVVLQGVYRQY